jgi:hypothetical protein
MKLRPRIACAGAIFPKIAPAIFFDLNETSFFAEKIENERLARIKSPETRNPKPETSP